MAMPPQPIQYRGPAFDPAILALLACPACHGDLSFEITQLTCVNCGHTYPVMDGIPVLTAERAETPVGPEAGR